MKITNCLVNRIVSPVGYDLGDPSFSWTVEDASGKRQTSARIVVESGGATVCDSGWGELSSLGTKLDLTLSPRTRYTWKVSVRSDADEVATSDENFFETGKMCETWTAKWITEPESDSVSRVYSKRFALKKDVSSARLYISGLGLYEAKINGEKVGDEHLTPYVNDYRTWIQYQTYDVSDMLRGDNVISVELADGWYKGRFGFKYGANSINMYGKTRKLIAEMHIKFADGTEDIVCTDTTWSVKKSSIIFSGIYDGEQRDDTLDTSEEKPALLLDENMPPLHDRMSLPILAHEVIKPVRLITTPKGENVYDLGQNFAGTFRLRVHEPRGAEIRVEVGEVMQGGNFYRDNLRTAKAEYVYISDGEEHTVEPKFTYYGYRYAKVEGVTDLKIDDFVGVALYSDVKDAGSITTGDEKINKLISNIRWGEKSNFTDIPTDCPQRDERMGWTGDTQVFAATACYLSDTLEFYRKHLKDLRAEQAHLDGAVPIVVPSFLTARYASVWGDAATIIPWTLYLMYGDKTVLNESVDSMAAWVDFITSVDGDDHGWRKIFHYGDWLALDHPARKADTVKGGTDEGYIADVYYMYSAELTAKAAKVIGKTAVAEKYSALARRIKSEIEKEYFTQTGRCAIATQTGYTLALMHDLTSDRERTLSDFINLIGKCDDKITTGFVGTPLILRVLSACGKDALAYKILHNEQYPGWLYSVNLGATTIWERWNSLDENGNVSSTGMNSFNHYAYGSVGQWIWECAAGISPDESAPGFKRAVIRPIADRGLKNVDAVYYSAAGRYKVSWKFIDETHVSLCVEIPFDCTAKLLLPYAKGAQEYELEAGTFELVYEIGE